MSNIKQRRTTNDGGKVGALPTKTDETPVKRYLRENEISVGWLARELDLNRAYLSTIINGWVPEATTRKWAPRIAAKLGVPVSVAFPDLPAEQQEGA